MLLECLVAYARECHEAVAWNDWCFTGQVLFAEHGRRKIKITYGWSRLDELGFDVYETKKKYMNCVQWFGKDWA